MAGQTESVALTLGLRAPRLAMMIPRDMWRTHAARSIRYLGNVWGGAGGIVVPSADQHPAVLRMLRQYDPDYITSLTVNLADFEAIQPGVMTLRYPSSNRRVPESRRAGFMASQPLLADQNLGPFCNRAQIEALAGHLNPFRQGGLLRSETVTPGKSTDNRFLQLKTPQLGPALPLDPSPLDLAIAIRTGDPMGPVSPHIVGSTDHQRAQLLTANVEYPARPFGETLEGLIPMVRGVPTVSGPVIVLGDSCDDFAFAMLWDRTVGEGVWLPFEAGEEPGLAKSVARALDQRRWDSQSQIRVTSISLSESECRRRIERIWDGAILLGPLQDPLAWEYQRPSELQARHRRDLYIPDHADVAVNALVTVDSGGGAAMMNAVPCQVPSGTDERLFGRWIVEVAAAGRHVSGASPGDVLQHLAAGSNEYDTVLRTTDGGIAYESRHNGWVSAGSTKLGQLARPTLRWPTALEALRTTASRSGYDLRPSPAGRLTKLSRELLTPESSLATALEGECRVILEAFCDAGGDNGPVDRGADFKDGFGRIRVNRRLLVPHAALARVLTNPPTDSALREWIDRFTATGALQAGFALRCPTCEWGDYYPVDRVNTRFECNRCGASEQVSIKSWLKPNSGPIWYYALHPAINDFIQAHGDVPVISALRIDEKVTRVLASEYEVELIVAADGHRLVEVDFVLETTAGRIVGEAKSSNNVGGQNRPERSREVQKKFTAATALAADELCFATAAPQWAPSSAEVIRAVAIRTKPRFRVSMLTDVGDHGKTQRTLVFDGIG